MRTIKAVMIMVLMTTAATLSAQSNYGTGEDSVKCVYNIGLYEPYAKNGNFGDAYEFWALAYETCPQTYCKLYFFGSQIINWRIH